MASGTVQSYNTLNYSGMLYAKGDEKTPLLTAIGGNRKLTDHVQFTTGQEYDAYVASAQPEITETASLTAPSPDYVTRSQKENVTQIFHKAVAISYAKMSNMGTLSGINVAGQVANPADELDFQVAQAMKRVRQDVEYTLVNGVYQKASNDGEANKTRGLNTAITSSTKAMASKPVGYWDVVDLMTTMDSHGADLDGLVLWCDRKVKLMINASAVENGLTVIPADRTINGIAVDKLETPDGTFYIREGKYLPANTAFLLNLSVLAPVEMNVPGKGNFFLEQLAKTGAGEQYQIFGQLGLDHGPEWMHGKFTGIKASFEAPKYNKKVFVVNSADAPLNTKSAEAKG